MEDIFIACVFLLFSIFILFTIWKLFKLFEKIIGLTDSIIYVFYILSEIVFLIGLSFHKLSFKEASDLWDACYSPIASRHLITLLVYFFGFNVSIYLIRVVSKKLPPLTIVIALIFIIIWIVISVAILFQVTKHVVESDHFFEDMQYYFLFAPLSSILIGIMLIARTIKIEAENTSDRAYSNKYLNFMNNFLLKQRHLSAWAIVLLLPLFLIITICLLLLGQDTNSIVKIFTDTATWRYSQHIHPPILDHTGHYLCTVAAKGDPALVKPLHLGKRNGKNIIVNRQLQIANAFEEMVRDFSPKMHKIIRSIYDKYGYNISQKINSVYLSNTTYILMKPIEYIFLISLYLFCYKPEEKISRQYRC